MAIQTRLGQIRGMARDSCTAFLGVRFGEPPVSEMRFMPPVAPGAWSGVYDATSWPRTTPWQAIFLNPGSIIMFLDGSLGSEVSFLWTHPTNRPVSRCKIPTPKP